MKQLLENLDYIRGLFNQHAVINGHYVGPMNVINVDDELRMFIDKTLIPVMNLLKQQEAKDAAFEGALQCIQHLARVVNEQTDTVAIVNLQSFKDCYYGS